MDRDPMEIVVTVDILALERVMNHLNMRDLLSCRLVSHLWNKSASLKLRQRSTMVRNIWTEDQLMELKARMERSWNFPFAGLHVSRTWKVQSDAAMDFFQNYGARFTRLHLDTYGMRKVDELAPFINALTGLSVLEFGHDDEGPFDRLSYPNPAAGQTDCKLELSHVQIIRIFWSFSGSNVDKVLGQVLEAAASPSLQIEFLDGTPDMLKIVKKAGKLQSVSAMKFDKNNHPSPTVKDDMDQLLRTGTPSLTKLYFHLNGCLSKDTLRKVLFASQRTLKELHLTGVCLSELSVCNCLAFTKLSTLSFDFVVRQDREYLFPGRHEGNFPALKHLKLELRYLINYWRVAFVDDLVLPIVKFVDVEGCMSEGGMKKLAQMFPNAVGI